MFILDRNRIVQEINHVAYEQIGYTKAEMLGRLIDDFILPEFIPLMNSRYATIQHQGFLIYETAQVRKDGSVLPVEICNRTIEFNGKKAYFAVVRDITSRKQIQLALQKSEQDLKHAQTIGHFGSWTHDMSGHITWSGELYKIFGVSPETYNPNTEAFYQLIHPEDLPAMQAWNDACVSGLKPEPIEWRCIRPDGTIRYIYGHGELVLDTAGRLSHLAGTVQDITELKQAEFALEAERNKLTTAFEFSKNLISTMQDGFSVLDMNGLAIDANDALCQMTGFSKEELTGIHPPFPYWPAEELENINAAFQRTLKGEFSDFELSFTHKSGKRFPVIVSPSAVRDRTGKIMSYTATVKDISERKQAETIILESENKWRMLFENMTTGFALHEVICNEQGKVIDYRFLEVNPAYERLTTLKAKEIIGRTLLDVLPGTETYWIDIFGDVAMNGKPTLYENYSKELGRWYQVSVFSPKLAQFAVIVSDITDIKQAEDELRIAATAFDSQESLMITDADGIILRINNAFSKDTGYMPEEVIGQTPRLLKSDRHNTDFYRDMWESIHRSGSWQGEIWDKRKNGEIYPKWLSISAVKGKDGTITHYVGSHIDITERKQSEEQIKHLAFYDHLTNLPNRLLLLDRLKQALVSNGRSGRQGALLFLDLDNFKNLNDTLGHDMGDMLLQQVTQRLASCVREGDTVARLGGDEFVVMLLDLSEQAMEAAAQTEIICAKILDIFKQPYQLGTHSYHCTASIGATLFMDHQQTCDELMKQADIAMYQAKKAGRNTLRFFDLQMQENISLRVALESELHNALQNRQFQLYYQIQVDGSNRPMGAEALIRWIHPVRNLISPAQFIPLAEESGLILEIGRWVLETACAQISAWQQNKITRGLTIAVNVSAKQFRQPDFVTQVITSVQSHGINPMLLKLELTESLLQENIDDTIATMNALNEIGVRFSLDDFGTGYSSLQYLKRLPLAQLKIDQSFVRDIASDSSDKAIVQTIIAMAASLDLEVIAEGVETEEQRRMLLNKGCSNYQGYLFGQPLPIEQFEASLKQG